MKKRIQEESRKNSGEIETEFLLASQANREILLESIKEGEAGDGTIYMKGESLHELD